MTDGIYVKYHGWDDTPSVLMNLIRSQCVVAVVKRLKVLATCREIWQAVSLVTNQPEEWTYLPPLVIWFFAHAPMCGSTFRSGCEYVLQSRRLEAYVSHRRTGVWSCSRATDIRPAHWMCIWSYSHLWWIWSTSRNERQTVALEQSLNVPSVWVRFTLARLKFDSGILRFSRRLRLLNLFAT
jgi:hypothetical protein